MIHVITTRPQYNLHTLVRTMQQGARVYAHGWVRRVLLTTPYSGAWYVLTAYQDDRGQVTKVTTRREDCKAEFEVTGSSFERYIEAIKEELVRA